MRDLQGNVIWNTGCLFFSEQRGAPWIAVCLLWSVSFFCFFLSSLSLSLSRVLSFLFSLSPKQNKKMKVSREQSSLSLPALLSLREGPSSGAASRKKGERIGSGRQKMREKKNRAGKRWCKSNGKKKQGEKKRRGEKEKRRGKKSFLAVSLSRFVSLSLALFAPPPS